jgi:hypothetical protein
MASSWINARDNSGGRAARAARLLGFYALVLAPGRRALSGERDGQRR